LDPYLPNWQTKCSKLARNDFAISQFQQDTLNGYLVLGCIAALILWNTIWSLKVQSAHSTLWSELILPSATTHGIMCHTEHWRTVDAIMKQLPFCNRVTLCLDRWASVNKQSITSIIGYCLDSNCASRKLDLALDEVGAIFVYFFESWLSMIG
jgi:hypothetical protein